MSSTTPPDRELNILPVESYYANGNFRPAVGQDLEISWSSGAEFTIKSKCKSSPSRKSVSRETCKRVKWSKAVNSREHCPVLQIKTSNELLTIKFDTKNSTWSATRYREFVNTFSHLTPLRMGAKMLWHEAQQVALNDRSGGPSEKHKLGVAGKGKQDGLYSNGGSFSRHQKRKESVPPCPDSREVEEEAFEKEMLSTSPKRRNLGQPANPPLTDVLSKEVPLGEHGKTANLQDEVVVVYPEGSVGAVTITSADLARLQPGEFLNDSVVEFGLKFWLKALQQKDPELADQIHIFNTFFYKKLSRTDPQQAYASVKKWTSKVDIFKKKFIIIPINEDLHWYLAIVYEPEHMLEVPPSRKETTEADEAARPMHDKTEELSATKQEANIDLNLKGVIQEPSWKDGGARHISGSLSGPNSRPTNDDAYGASAGAIGDLDRVDAVAASPNWSQSTSDREKGVDGDKGKERERVMPHQGARREAFQPEETEMFRVEHPKTYIFTLDSLGIKRPKTIQRLAQYLKMEARDKKNAERSGLATGKFCSVPIQPNFCDCGIYLLHFVRTFLEDPTKSCRMVLKGNCMSESERQDAWKHAEVKGLREEMIRCIQGLSAEQKKMHAARVEAKEGEREARDVIMGDSESDIEITASRTTVK